MKNGGIKLDDLPVPLGLFEEFKYFTLKYLKNTSILKCNVIFKLLKMILLLQAIYTKTHNWVT